MHPKRNARCGLELLSPRRIPSKRVWDTSEVPATQAASSIRQREPRERSVAARRSGSRPHRERSVAAVRERPPVPERSVAPARRGSEGAPARRSPMDVPCLIPAVDEWLQACLDEKCKYMAHYFQGADDKEGHGFCCDCCEMATRQSLKRRGQECHHGDSCLRDEDLAWKRFEVPKWSSAMTKAASMFEAWATEQRATLWELDE